MKVQSIVKKLTAQHSGVFAVRWLLEQGFKSCRNPSHAIWAKSRVSTRSWSKKKCCLEPALFDFSVQKGMGVSNKVQLSGNVLNVVLIYFGMFLLFCWNEWKAEACFRRASEYFFVLSWRKKLVSTSRLKKVPFSIRKGRFFFILVSCKK